MPATATATRLMSMGLPAGRKVPRGKTRWYVVQAPQGREQSTCARVLKTVPESILQDAFFLQKEKWLKRNGVWGIDIVPLYQGYFFAVTDDVLALDSALSKLTFPARLINEFGRGFMPLALEAQQWFEACMDEEHVLRSSTANIIDGQLQIYAGPLVGQENRVRKIDRHHRRCLVDVFDADGGFTEQMPLDVPFKS